MNKHSAILPDGTVVTRNSKTMRYAHCVAARKNGEWGFYGWSQTTQGAVKMAREAELRGYPRSDIQIVNASILDETSRAGKARGASPSADAGDSKKIRATGAENAQDKITADAGLAEETGLAANDETETTMPKINKKSEKTQAPKSETTPLLGDQPTSDKQEKALELAEAREEKAPESSAPAQDPKEGEALLSFTPAVPEEKKTETAGTPDPGVLPEAEQRAEEAAKGEDEKKTETAGTPEEGGTAEAGAKEISRNYAYQKRIKALKSTVRFGEYAKLPQSRCDVMLEESETWASDDPEIQGWIDAAREKVRQAKALLAEAGAIGEALPEEVIGKKKAEKSAASAPDWKPGEILRLKAKTGKVEVRAIYVGMLTEEEMDHLVFSELRGTQTLVKTKAGREIFIPKGYLSRPEK